MKIEAFEKTDSLQHALLLAKDRDYTPVVYLDWSSAAWQDETCMALLKNLSSFEKLEEAHDTQCSFLGIVDAEGNPSSEILDPDTPEWKKALGGNDVVNTDSADAYVAIFDKTDGKFLGMKAFETSKELVSKIDTAE